jgi:CcmD family protein
MMDELMALYIAYTIIWIGLLGYLAYIHMKQTKLSRELELLEDAVKKNDGK